MFAGHLGAALGLKAVDRRVNLGLLFLAAMLLDVLLWLFVLGGVEQVIIPPPSVFAGRHYLTFVFPYSHGLLSSLLWSVAAGGAIWLAFPRDASARWRSAVVVAAAVFSHFVLDALVHVPELPLAGRDSPKIGFSLWNSLPLAIGLEVLVTGVGLFLYLKAVAVGRARTIGLVVLMVVVTALTIAGMTVAPAPSDPRLAALGPLATIVVLAAILFWLDRVAPTSA